MKFRIVFLAWLGLFGFGFGTFSMASASDRGHNGFPMQSESIANPVTVSANIYLAEVTLENAINKAKSKYGGKVLSAKQIESKGPLVYKIKLLLPNGRVKTVFVDGTSGDVFEA